LKIPFQLHRRIPLIRRPFVQRDRALAERDIALRQIDEALQLADEAAVSPDASRAAKRLEQARAATGIPTFFWHPDQAAEQAQCASDFRGYIQRHVSKHEPSLEIGPSFRPIISKKLGYRVTVVDHCEQAELKQKYKGHNLPLEMIEEVDKVWTTGLISDRFPNQTFKAIVSSHSIEHMPDLVSFLRGISGILSKDGSFFLIVPDKRYLMDIHKPASDLAKVLADHKAKLTLHSFETLVRNSNNVSCKAFVGGEGPAWGQFPIKDLTFVDPDFRASFEAGIAAAEAHSSGGGYFDAHGNYFTPSSFALLLAELAYLGFIDLRVDLLTRANSCEFLAVLKHTSPEDRPSYEQFQRTRKFLLVNTLREQREMLAYMAPLLNGDDLAMAAE
jgi:hypothetical protein